MSLACMLLVMLASPCSCADLVIEVPGAAGDSGGHYRLDYHPPEGEPRPNFTVPARANTINFQGLPGTKYHFMLYYSNSSGELLTWNQTITTAPEPPTNVSVALGGNKQATVSWRPPLHGDYSGFRFKLAALTPGAPEPPPLLSAPATARELALRDLLPGGTYTLHALTTLGDKESAAYATTNFTTKPNTPGKFIVWFRNETTLLVLWQPPYPAGAYTHYKVAILPADARDAELYVEKEGEPPGPAQAAFKGLVPGRAYDISVQTVSEQQSSAPTTAQYRTVPLKPRAVRTELVAEHSLTARWTAPPEPCEFDRYQVSLVPVDSGVRRPPAAVLPRERTQHSFEGLEPGALYSLAVKTMSGKVTSWPAQVDVALKPLPVRDLEPRRPEEGSAITLTWRPQEGSSQDSYEVTYADATGEGGSLTTLVAEATLSTLAPGRNYTFAVSAVSRSVRSDSRAVSAATRPAPADSLDARPTEDGRLRVAWTAAGSPERWELRWRRADDHDPTEHRADVAGSERTHSLEELRPGAGYRLRLRARALGLPSSARTLLAALPPLPPRSVTVSRASSDSALVRWLGPEGNTELSGFVLRYRTQEADWTTLPRLSVNASEAEVTDMTHGERYTVRVDTVAELPDGRELESGRPLSADHATNPDPVSDVVALVDTTNLTLEWVRPSGRVEWYSVSWWEVRAGGRSSPEELRALSPGIRLSGLSPGKAYGLAIASISYNLSSDVFTMETRTRPLIRSEIIVSDAGDHDENATGAFLQVSFTPTPGAVTEFDTYRFTLEGEPWKSDDARHSTPRHREVPADSVDRRVRFSDLVPGRLYNITMVTLSHNVSSHPVQRQARLKPLPVMELRAVSVETHTATVAWSAPPGVVGDYLVEYLKNETTAATSPRNESTAATSLALIALLPDTEYIVSVYTRAGTAAALPARADPASLTMRTREAPPAAPLLLRVTDTRPTALSFEWSLPLERRHGRLLRLELLHWAPDRDEAPVTDAFPPEATGGEVRGLRAGARYVFELRGVTAAGAGAGLRWEGALPLGPPPVKPHATPFVGSRAATSLAVRFRGDSFLHDNGNVSAYTLVVAEDPSLPATARTLPSWRDVQRYDVWPPYQVAEPYYPFASRDEEEFTIGTERCERVRRPYCNGPLKPSTTYHVKLRAFTAPDKYTDTEYVAVATESDGSAWAAGGAAIAALCLLGAGAGAALWRRKRRPGVSTVPRLSRPVPAERFAEHYRAMAADSDFRFSEEFEELKSVGREQSCLAAELPCNRPKNRFTNILPYDHSRFKLRPADDEEGSDYINANYVPGHSSPREFIVTQGPLHGTRDDFWRMVWESGSRAIVMLTRCVEKGREKCDRYWPTDTRPALYGEIEVTALTESRYPDWTVSEFLVSRGGEQRRVQHWHFTTWPDFGVPEPPTALLRFVRAFRAAAGASRPVVVHCSAGVGRSGTFVVLDRVLQQLAARQPLDVLGAVAAARRERAWLVQTEQQYSCVHQCVLAALDPREDSSPPPLQHNNQAFEDDEGIAESGM